MNKPQQKFVYSKVRATRIAELISEGQRRLSCCGFEATVARREARMLLACSMKLSTTQLFMREKELATPEEIESFEEWLTRRCNHEPYAYICGQKEFYGYPFRVDPNVLIPRPESEELVTLALEYLEQIHVGAGVTLRLLDLCCGSGAIGLSLLAEQSNAQSNPEIELDLSDISEQALAVARGNARRLLSEKQLNHCHFYCGELFEPIPADRSYQLILCNPPYIRRNVEELNAMSRETRDYEPEIALYCSDPLELYREIADNARRRLAPAGLLAIELSPYIAEEVLEACRSILGQAELRRDMSGHYRIISYQAPQ